jgi:hypothetical protein
LHVTPHFAAHIAWRKTFYRAFKAGSPHRPWRAGCAGMRARIHFPSACMAAAGSGASSPMVFAFTLAGGRAAEGLRRMTFFPVRSFCAGPLVSGPMPGSSRNIHILSPCAIHTTPATTGRRKRRSSALLDGQPPLQPLRLFFATPSNWSPHPGPDPAREGEGGYLRTLASTGS